jgi:hypothetical protein
MQQAANRKGQWWMAILGVALAIGIGTLSSPSILRAQAKPGASLQGTWLASVTLADGSTTLSLLTFMDDGNALEENNSPRILSLAHGAWMKTGEGQFSSDRVKFQFDGPTTRLFTGTIRFAQKIQLDTPDSFHSTTTRQLFDAAGNPAGPPLTDTATAKRLYATASPLPVQGP